MADTPKYVRLTNRLSGRTCVDLQSGWSISGLDVVEVPDRKKSPNAHRFIRDKLNRGVLEPASRAEFEEVEEASEESRERFAQRLQGLSSLGIRPASLGFAVHQEGEVQKAAQDRRASIEAKRAQTSDEEDEVDPDEVENYDDLKVPQLRSLLQDRELPTDGTKAELVARLEESDEESEDDDDDEE